MNEFKTPRPKAYKKFRVDKLALSVFLLLGIPSLGIFAASNRLTSQPLRQVAQLPQSMILVNTTDDELNNDGDCSLREAISAANQDTIVDECNAGSEDDEIQLPAGIYTFSLSGTGEDENMTGDLDILQNLSIFGADSRTTIVNGDDVDSVFHVHAGAGLQLWDMTIENGGTSYSSGGGIHNYGELYIYNSTLRDNLTTGNGGAIYSEGSLHIANSTLLDNFAGMNGGAIFLRYGDTTIVNSTISGNSTYGDGGGISVNKATLSMNNVTITENVADEDEAVWGDGGGIIVIDGRVDFSNSIIAGNVDSGGEAPDCNVFSGGELVSGDYNLVEDTSGCTITGVTINNIYGQDPLLAALGTNGGPTETHALTGGSPAMDAANPSTPSGSYGTCEETDQRGVSRPINGDGDETATCDIGAFESSPLQGSCGGIFPAVADASVFNFLPDTNTGENTSLALLSNDSEDEGRILLAFYLGGDIPSDSQILRADLELTLYESGEPYPYQIYVYNLEEGFIEDEVTWNTQPEIGKVYGSLISELDSGILSIDVTSMVAGWVQGTISETLMLVPAGEINQSFKSKETGEGPRLRISCAPPSLPVPADLSSRDPAQQAGLQRLQENSTLPVMIDFGIGGSLRFAGFQIAIPEAVGPSHLEQVQWFLDAYSDTLRLDHPIEELQLVRRSTDGRDLFFRQRVNGIPVFPSSVGLHILSEDMIGFNGNYVPDLTVDSTPSLTAEGAGKIALEQADGNTLIGEIQLRYLNLGLLGHDDESTYLSWLVNVEGEGYPGSYFIDAHTGQVRLWLPDAIEAYDMELSTANLTGVNVGTIDWDKTDKDDQWFNEDGPYAEPPDPTPPAPDADGTNGWIYSQSIYDYYKDTFGQDSFDDKGQLIRHFVHYLPQWWHNACYVSRYDVFEYGDGFVALDIMAHEFTHAFTRYNSNLVYGYQPGALNESFSDIFGQYVDNEDWLIGEDVPDGPLRDMSDPPNYGDPDKMSDYVLTENDFGGVHTNCGIHNKAAYLMVHGGSFNGWTVTGIGQEKAEQLFYKMQTEYLTENAHFIDARNAAVWIASLFASTFKYDFTDDDVCQVRNAYAAVELGNGDVNCDGVEENSPVDSDLDGMPDSIDNCPTIANADQRNLDKDALGDACDPDLDGDGQTNESDNCPLVANPDQADGNKNDIGDMCDDRDGDGDVDGKDNCPDIYNPDQLDGDYDGFGDLCDPDRDYDGVPNELDNCPDDYNPLQENYDHDDYGYACDLCPKTPSVDNTDTDGDGRGDVCDLDDDDDGIPDTTDNCPKAYNPQQYDGNHNNIGLACDLNEANGLEDGTTSEGEVLFPDANNPWRITLPVCSQCSDAYLPENYREVIHINLPTGFRARVVDSTGYPVVTSEVVTGELDLVFYPEPHGISRESALGRFLAYPSYFSMTPDQVRYMLMIYPSEGTDTSEAYPLSLQLRISVGDIYLPLILH